MASTVVPLFSTNIWCCQSNIDNDFILKECYKFSKKTDGIIMSNRGGYQGEGFNCDILNNFIKYNLPVSPVDSLDEFKLFSWVNINPKGSKNLRHNHFDVGGNVVFSGVYYVKVPKDSGCIRFFDPRGFMIHSCLDMKYFHGHSKPVFDVEPQAGDCVYFPSWLEHDVEDNKSNEDRVSIAFNVLR